MEVAAGVIPAASGLFALLADVLADVGDGGMVVAVELDGGGEAEPPAWEVVDGVALAVPVAAVDGLQGVVEEAVKVDSPVLVPFGHQDVGQPPTADLVIEPGVELAGDFGHVVAADLGLVEGEGDEPAEGVGEGQVSDLGACSAHGAFAVVPVLVCGFLGVLAGPGGPFFVSGGFPAVGVENSLVAGQDFQGAVWIGFNPGGMANASTGSSSLGQERRHAERVVDIIIHGSGR